MPYPGTWQSLIDRFGEHALADTLKITTSILSDMAHNVIPTGIMFDDMLLDICIFHGIMPRLYRHPWKYHHGILIASTPAWYAWTLENGWSKRTRFIGNPDLLTPIDNEFFALAQEKGWPWRKP